MRSQKVWFSSFGLKQAIDFNLFGPIKVLSSLEKCVLINIESEIGYRVLVRG